MESIGFNMTLLAQLVNFIILFVLIAAIGRLAYVLLTGRSKSKQARRMEEELYEVKARLGEIEKKLDKKG